MTGTVQEKKQKSGKNYYYIRLKYQEPVTQKWKDKWISTGLPVKSGNKRKASALMNEVIEKHAYLECKSELSKDILLSDYVARWLAMKKVSLRPSTYEAYEYRAGAIKKYFAEKKVVDITPQMVDTFFRYSLIYGKRNQRTGEKEALSVRSVRSYRSILYAVFTQAMIDNLITINPTLGVHVSGKRNKEFAEEYLFLTEEEISDFIHFLATNLQYRRFVPIAFFGAYYGMRRSEILGLKWNAINFKKGIISIKHTVVRVKNITPEDLTKTPAGRRDLALFPTAITCLQSIKEEQDRNKKFFGNEYKNTEGYLFTWEDGHSYNPDYISKLFGKATKAYGRPEITLHKLRHSCASMLIEKGWDPKKLQYWLGHEDISVTLNIYSHFNKQRLNTCSADLNEISNAVAELF